MESHSVLLKEAVFEEWSNLKDFLGFSNSSNFASHILQNYKDLHSITDNDILSKKSGRGEHHLFVNGVRIKKESTDDLESNSCDSVEMFSAASSPDPGYQHYNRRDPLNNRSRKKQHRSSSWGLESVVQRLHQAKVESRGGDDDGWIQEGEPSCLSYYDGRRLPLLDRVKIEQPSDVDEEDRYDSPKIIPDSARSIANQNTMMSIGHDPHDINSTYTLRKLLEKPSVNASAELRLNAAELKERGVVINPAISYEVERSHPFHLPLPGLHSNVKHRGPELNQPPESLALDSLIRMALLAKEDEVVPNHLGREAGDPSQSEKELLENQGINMGTFRQSLFQIPQAFRDGNPSLAPRGPAASSVTDAPSLKSILRGRDTQNNKPEDVSMAPFVKMEDQAGENSFGMASAASALQHLAQMQDSHQTNGSRMKLGSQKSPKVGHQKRHKHDKQRRRHRSGSKKKNNVNPLPTVKYLLEKKREGFPLSKFRVRLKSRKDADARSKKHHVGVEHGHKSRRNRGLQDSPVKRNSRKRGRVPKKQPIKLLPKPNSPASPPPAAIDISSSASQMMKLIAEQGNPASVNSSTPAQRSYSSRCSAISAPRLKITTARSLNNSASEVMKLLASKNQELRPTTPVPRNRIMSSTLINQASSIPPPPPYPHPTPPYPHPTPPKLDDLGKSVIGAADIMKQLANSYSQNSPRSSKYPLSLMFVNPPASDSSSAFSLMKQLITKSS